MFKLGNFILASGKETDWKIDCDTLTDLDWDALAKIAADNLPPFKDVYGVPTGGCEFALSLSKYKNPNADFILIAEDVVTTGGSMERFVATLDLDCDFIGVAVFSRENKHPNWVTPMFSFNLT